MSLSAVPESRAGGLREMPAPDNSSLRGNARLSVLVALAALAVAFAAVMWLGARHDRSQITDQTAALTVAQQRLPLLLSYNYATLTNDLARSMDQTTGTFSDDYAKLVNEVVRSTARNRQISTKATISGAGVISQRGNDVLLVVFLTQRTTAPGATPSVTSSEVDVTMRRTGGTWKVSALSPH